MTLRDVIKGKLAPGGKFGKFPLPTPPDQGLLAAPSNRVDLSTDCLGGKEYLSVEHFKMGFL